MAASVFIEQVAEVFEKFQVSALIGCERDGLHVFFDRGITELAGYHRMMGLPTPAHFRKAAEQFRYNPKVFVAPPWPEIFANDAERKQSLGEAVRTHDAVVRIYAEFGYTIVSLPKTSVEERLGFVLAEARL